MTEIQMIKTGTTTAPVLEIRISNLFRISGFGFRAFLSPLPEVHELDAGRLRHGEGFFVAVELAVVDARDAGVGDQLETGPAGARGRVQLGSGDGHTVA